MFPDIQFEQWRNDMQKNLQKAIDPDTSPEDTMALGMNNIAIGLVYLGERFAAAEGIFKHLNDLISAQEDEIARLTQEEEDRNA